MPFFSHLRLGQRLALGFGVVLALLLVIAALALGGMRTLNQSLHDVAIRGGKQTAAVMEMERSANRFMATLTGIRGAELSEGQATMKLAREQWLGFQAARQTAGELLADGDPSVQPLLAAIDAQAVQVHELIPLGEKGAEGRGDTAAFFTMSLMLANETEKWSKRNRDWSAALVAVSAWNAVAEQGAVAAAMADADQQRNLVIAGCGFALLFGVFTAWRITRDVTQGFSATVEATERMAKHDLSVPMDVHFKGELGVLARALESMRLAQHDLASGVRQACDDIALASAEIAQGSQDLSGRTELAATNTQGAIGALNELDMSVDQASQSAQSANSLAADAQSAATRGDHVVGQAVATMNEIDAASRQIADITAIIDGIAFQTNILALNAAVEAARAGEQGRGFAVVAAEVRSLAQRSATAAREIRGLIDATLEKVVTGSEHVRRAGSATSEIMVSVQRVSSTIESIAAEGAQQRQGIGQAKSSVDDLDRGAQQNAALAEESAAAASSLRDQADRLKGLVERFRLQPA